MKLSNQIPVAILFIFSMFLTFSLQAQILQPVTWHFSHERIGNDRYELHFTAVIDEGWYIYGLNIPAGGPIPTGFEFHANPDFRLIGQILAPDPYIKYDPNFNMELPLYSNEVTFRQVIEVPPGSPVNVSGQLVFMSCTQTICLPPDYIDFVFNLSPVVNKRPMPGTQTLPVQPQVPTSPDSIVTETKPPAIINQAPARQGLDDTYHPAVRSFFGAIIAGFIGGLLALLTPCVFPMIPLTVSFFLRNSGNKTRAIRDALIYGITIIFSYVVIGLIVSVIFGPDTLNALATSPGFNIFFFLLLVAFAVSFFGAFELTLPSTWTTALDNKAERSGGILGSIFMGFTFVLISFSCTGPIVGTLLVDAATTGNVVGPALGMFGFSLALAIPFTLFAVFPTALKKLPKSGSWMNAIKVILGFIVLAFALKFLAVADAVGQWGLISREVFISVWIGIFLLLGMYLLGKIRLAHDSETSHLSVPRLLLALISIAFVFYLLPGLWGSPLKAVSSFLPSLTRQEFNINQRPAEQKSATGNIIYVGESVREGPHGLLSFTDYNEGVNAARIAGKPIFLDFTGHGCANCRKMEAQVWSDPQVLDRLANDFVKISLFVDDRTPLPQNEQFVSDVFGRERTIRNYGQKWSVFQAEVFGLNTQPFYVILDHDENIIAPTHGYDLNISRFIEFLDTGKRNFNQQQN